MNKAIEEMPDHFKEDQKQLITQGISSWNDIKNLSNAKINALLNKTTCSKRNLIFLRGMAELIVQLGISHQYASLLIHSGIYSIEVLANLTPEELIKRLGRLNRQNKIWTNSSIDLSKANYLIKEATKKLNTP